MGKRKKSTAKRDSKERDNYTCQLCNRDRSKVKVTSHHIKPRHEGGIDELKNLVTLCTNCHNKVTKLYHKGVLHKGNFMDWLNAKIGGINDQQN